MPAYNAQEHIRAAIDSLLGQTFGDFELVIVDNASTDETRDICLGYAEIDPRVRYVRNDKNIGVSKNYNRAFTLSRSEYFKWASSNDTCGPRSLETCFDVLRRHPDAAVCYPKTKLVYGPNETEDYEDNLDLQQESAEIRFLACIDRLRLNNVLNGLIRSEALHRTKLHGAYLGADLNMMAELSLYGKFVEVPEPMLYRAMDKNTASRYHTANDVIRMYDPGGERSALFQSWRFHMDRFAIVQRAPLPAGTKLRLYRRILQMMAWDRRSLFDDMAEAGWLIRGSNGRESPT